MEKPIQFLKARVLELTFASASLILVLTTLPSCNNSKPEDTKEVAEEHNDAKFDNAKEDDAKFALYGTKATGSTSAFIMEFAKVVR